MTLTATLEDYLEAIFNLCRFDNAARSRDIAESLNVHKSTVTAALKSLGQMRLINYAPYEAVTLTLEGRKLAEDVVRRHSALKNFFVDVLKVDAEQAEKAACGMEHSIPREIVEKLARFVIAMHGCPRISEDDLGKANRAGDVCLKCDEKLPGEISGPGKDLNSMSEQLITLDSVEPGRTVAVASVTGSSEIKKRLTELGVVKGTKITVERIAPMGDPMDMKIKGYHLSLRKQEAANVVVI